MKHILKYTILEKSISVYFTIKVGSLIRLAIMSHYGRQNNNAVSRTLAGKDSNGVPLSGHDHVFYIPTDDDYDGYLDHIEIMTNTEFTLSELNAIKAVCEIHSSRDGIHAHLILCNDLEGDNLPITEHKKWISKTPFILNRHMKIRGEKMIDTPKDQVILELKRRYPLYDIRDIIITDNNSPMCISKMRPNEFKRIRKPDEKPMPAYEVIIEFNTPISKPLFLGYGCHFGLGMFVPYVDSKYD